MSYANYTYNDRNPLRRFAHKVRFRESIDEISPNPDGSVTSVLDFGCGDAQFLNKLREADADNFRFLGYDPYPEPIADNKVEIFDNWQQVEDYVDKYGRFDYIFCMEVLEHLGDDAIDQALDRMIQALKPDGVLIISVPVECGIPALIKGVLRRRDHRLGTYYTWPVIMRTLFAAKVDHLLLRDNYYEHLGFYYKDLQRRLRQRLRIEKRWFSPIGTPFHNLNSQVFYRLKQIDQSR